MQGLQGLQGKYWDVLRWIEFCKSSLFTSRRPSTGKSKGILKLMGDDGSLQSVVFPSHRSSRFSIPQMLECQGNQRRKVFVCQNHSWNLRANFGQRGCSRTASIFWIWIFVISVIFCHAVGRKLCVVGWTFRSCQALSTPGADPVV